MIFLTKKFALFLARDLSANLAKRNPMQIRRMNTKAFCERPYAQEKIHHFSCKLIKVVSIIPSFTKRTSTYSNA